jgi:putative transposase
MLRKAPTVTLTQKQKKILTQIVFARKTEKRLYQRAKIILDANDGVSNSKISRYLDMRHETIAHWRNKWIRKEKSLIVLEEAKAADEDYFNAVIQILSDEERPGAPCIFTPEQVCQIVSVACEKPELSGYPVSHWSMKLLAQEVKRRGIVESISVTQVGRFLKSIGNKATPS